MTLGHLRDLQVSWETSPPLHLLVAAYLGALKEKPKRATKADMAEMMQFMGGK